jgi:hypothetical protein
MRPSLRPAAFAALILLGAGTLAQQAFADAPTPDTPPASMPSATMPPPPPAGPAGRPAPADRMGRAGPADRAAPADPMGRPAPTADRPGRTGRATPPPAPTADAGARMPVLTGRVQRWLVNPNGEVDGLLLADGTQVAFPPHLSAAAQQLLKPGDEVRVAGWRTPDAPMVRASRLTATASGRSLDDTPASASPPPPAPRDPGALTAMSGSGRVARLLHTGRGDVNGVILDDGLIVRFPPHVGAELAASLQPGATISARGWGSRGAQGRAFEATAIGATAADMREVFAGPGRAPGAPRGPGAMGAPGAPGAPGAAAAPDAPRPGAVPPPPPGAPSASNAPVAPPAGS